MVQNWSTDGWFARLLGVLKMPKNLATPKKCGKIKKTPFLNSFKVSDSKSEVRILIKILVLKLSKLMTLFVRNCTPPEKDKLVQGWVIMWCWIWVTAINSSLTSDGSRPPLKWLQGGSEFHRVSQRGVLQWFWRRDLKDYLCCREDERRVEGAVWKEAGMIGFEILVKVLGCSRKYFNLWVYFRMSARYSGDRGISLVSCFNQLQGPVRLLSASACLASATPSQCLCRWGQTKRQWSLTGPCR